VTGRYFSTSVVRRTFRLVPFLSNDSHRRANSSNEITACKRLFTRCVLKEIVRNYIIPGRPTLPDADVPMPG